MYNEIIHNIIIYNKLLVIYCEIHCNVTIIIMTNTYNLFLLVHTYYLNDYEIKKFMFLLFTYLNSDKKKKNTN